MTVWSAFRIRSMASRLMSQMLQSEAAMMVTGKMPSVLKINDEASTSGALSVSNVNSLPSSLTILAYALPLHSRYSCLQT